MNPRNPKGWYTVKRGKTHRGDKKMLFANVRYGNEVRVECQGWVRVSEGEDVRRHNIVIRRRRFNAKAWAKGIADQWKGMKHIDAHHIYVALMDGYRRGNRKGGAK